MKLLRTRHFWNIFGLIVYSCCTQARNVRYGFKADPYPSKLIGLGRSIERFGKASAYSNRTTSTVKGNITIDCRGVTLFVWKKTVPSTTFVDQLKQQKDLDECRYTWMYEVPFLKA